MALSQMMQHWQSIKDKYPDCIIFYRLGDFYEMFFEDAEKAAPILDLTLTGRDCGLEKRAPMCGVPYHAVDGYIATLIANGLKVAICEQLEDPAQAKGMVARDVIRVVTAGTQIDEEHLDEKSNNFICCAYKKGNLTALAWADITTGEFCATEYVGEHSLAMCLTQMQKLGVKEIVCNDEMLFATKDTPEVTRGLLPHFSSYPAWAFGDAAAENSLFEQFKTKTLSAYSIAGKKGAIASSGALLEYLRDTQKHALKNIDTITYVTQENFMQLDTTACRNLELVKNMGDGKKYGSLLWLLDKTKTGMGARLLQSFILSPLGNIETINYRLDGVEELYNATVVRLGLVDSLKTIKDIERLTGKISNGNVMPRDCLALADSLSVLPNLQFQLSGFKSRILTDIRSNLFDMSDLVDLINSAIEREHLPPLMKDGGYIKAGYNVRLDELRNIRDNGQKLIVEMEARERDETGIRNLRINYNRVFGYYIEVTKSFKDKVPLSYQRKQTLTNAERYTTEELRDLEEKILTGAETSLKLEAALYEEIKSVLSANIARLKTVSSAVGLLDVLVSFAEVAKTNRYVRPTVVESNQPLVIKDGRHPVVEAISKERFIANDTLLDENENRTMIITGPNMAGKSTYMRQTAIIALMAHIGSFVPASAATIPLIDRIFTRVGASDNLILDQSTFMVEMIEVASILQNATKNSLLILDEVGRGTSTYDGLSIAWAVIETLTQKIGAKTLFATHYHELTQLESRLAGVKNYKISVKETGGTVVFLRKIMRGGANRSFGIEVAALAGVPQEVTERAKQILKKIEKSDVTKKVESAYIDDLADDISTENSGLETGLDGAFDEAQALQNNETYNELVRILKDVDMDNLTPMKAFYLVSDLVEKVKDGKD